MNQEKLQELFDRYAAGQCSPEEEAQLKSWLTFGQFNGKTLSEAELQASLKRLDTRLPLTGRTIRLWPRVLVAASLLLVISVAAWFLLKPKANVEHLTANLIKNDVQPGRNQATLTLANGKTIILKQGMTGHLASQGKTSVTANGSDIVYRDEGETAISYNTLTTAKGQQWLTPVVLADGTRVYLNAQSSLTYPTAFTGKERIVKMTGEAYFEVKHDLQHPFKVQVGSQTVEDIGTEFNINAYTDEPSLKTTLVQGKVMVSTASKTIGLLPGQASDLKNEQLSKSAADIRSATAWRKGLFHFQEADLNTVMRQFGRWYDIEVIDQSNRTGDEFVGDIPRTATLTKALKIFNMSGVHFKLEGKRLTLMP